LLRFKGGYRNYGSGTIVVFLQKLELI
jgi:hypothetical protein